jgi:MoaA/NifB/PqqE/SkfB family radical SAM enzyme
MQKENAGCAAHPQSFSAKANGTESLPRRKNCVAFILLAAGGEPLLRKEVLARAARYKKHPLSVFTNGTLLEGEAMELFDRNRNLVPILSLEGDRLKRTDDRRGEGVYDRLNRAMEALRRRKIFFGASITVTTENIALVTGEAFIRRLAESGCKAVIFVEYVPVTPESVHLAPKKQEREFLLTQSHRLQETFRPMIFLSFPGDEEEMGGCLAAGRGFFHINAYGGAEPCPFSPFSDVNLKEISLLEALHSPLFRRLRESGLFAEEHTGGCLLFEHRDEVEALLKSGDFAAPHASSE